MAKPATIDRVVILVKDNHTFDNYLGSFRAPIMPQRRRGRRIPSFRIRGMLLPGFGPRFMGVGPTWATGRRTSLRTGCSLSDTRERLHRSTTPVATRYAADVGPIGTIGPLPANPQQGWCA